MPEWIIRILTSPEDMAAAEVLQRQVWGGAENDAIPAHMLLAVVHNGGLALGAFVGAELVGLVFGFPALVRSADGTMVMKHHSHILGIRPDWQEKGIGFALKRAQWQLVRKQGLERITWTYDPLLSRNSHLNIARLGAVCNTYLRAEYGEMRDGLNAGLPSDRFQVDWWLNTSRVERRLGHRARPAPSLGHYRAAGADLLEASFASDGTPRPPAGVASLEGSLLLVEIPSDFMALKGADLALARDWRFYTREVFEDSFARGFIVTDFIHARGRSYHLLTHGEATF